MHLPTLRAKRDRERQLDQSERKLRDATEAELCQEPDVVLEALKSGAMFATWMTRQLAISELERRHGDRRDVYDQETDRLMLQDPRGSDWEPAGSVMDAVLAVLRDARPQLVLVDPEQESAAAIRRAKQAFDERPVA